MLMSAEGKPKLWDTCMEDISLFHGQSHITHVLWNHSGSYFTSIDEEGKLAIWSNKRYLNAWLPVYMVKFPTPVVCCEWINPERMYVASKSDGNTKYERERTGRPRSPLALVVLASDGQLTTLFKPAGQLFTHTSTNLPRRSVTEDLASSRITHGSMMSSADGIHLVTHSSNILPSTVNLYQIDLRFTPEVTFRCEAVAILHITNLLTGPGSVMIPGSVMHLQLLPQTSTKSHSVAVALGAREEHLNGDISYKSQVVVWDVMPKLMGFHPAFQELSTRRNDAVSGQPLLTFVLLGERRFEDKFVSTLAYVPRSRELVVGFSDGSILGLESRYLGLLDLTPTLQDGFQKEAGGSPIIAISPSPNGFTLLYYSLDEQISSIETSETSGYGLDLEASKQSALLAILNEWDYSDIVAIVVKAFRISGDEQLPDRLLEGIFKSYEAIKGAEDSSTIEPFMPKASIMRRMLAFQLVLFQALPYKLVQFRATFALLHLQSIGEIFSGCCTSDPATLAAHLDQGTGIVATPAPLAFDTNSLWSLFPLFGWVLDFCTVLFRELAIFLNMKSAEPQGASSIVPQRTTSPTTGALKPSLLCFLFHSRSRKTLRSVLTLVDQYYQFVKIREHLYMRALQVNGPIAGPAGQGLANHTNSMSIPEAHAVRDIQINKLSANVEATFSRCPVKIVPAKSMLKDLSGLCGQADMTRSNGTLNSPHRANDGGVLDKAPFDHVVFIKGTIPSSNSKQTRNELRITTQKYPALWDMNRLIFATIHWLDLEPANTLIGSKATPKQRIAAMHPSRCRIDPSTAPKTRVLIGTHGVGRPLYPVLHHHSSSISNVSAGSRGSIGGGSDKPAMPSKVFAESPAEMRAQPFGEASSSSAIGAVGAATHGGPSDLSRPTVPGTLTIWGLAFDNRDEDYSDDNHQDDKDDGNAILRSIWKNWSPSLHGQHHPHAAARNSHGGDGVEMVPDDDVLDEHDDGDEHRDSDSDMQDATIDGASGKGDVARGRRTSLAGVLTPSSNWLLRESQAISKKTRLEWTVFPALSDERSYTGPDNSRGPMMESLGLGGHVAPVDLQPSEFNVHSQTDIEAQVRKRRFGVDPIRKVKKYKTTGNGRRCIRCLQIATNNTNSNGQKRVLPHQIGSSPNIIPDIAAATLWYHNYDRSCICGGMWLEL